ncbi:MAG: hypothetical protein WA090_03555 [Candidatus Nanopelagicaceae bacterium]
MSVYLGPSTPRWEPTNEQDLESAIQHGIISENHYVELKAKLDTGPVANRELARDLVQFAVDSGVLIIGIKENTDHTLSLSPVALNGLAERIEQVARSIPDPLLPVAFLEIPSEGDPSKGYLLVKIPVTGGAPHMVDGVYYGRGDKMKVRLSDSRVTSLHEERARRRADIESRLDRTIGRDPIPSVIRKQAHIFVVATPNANRTETAVDFVRVNGWQQRVRDLVNNTFREVNFGSDQTGPLDDLQNTNLRSDGIALTSLQFRSDRTIDHTLMMYEDASELELTEDGEIRVFSGLFSRTALPQHMVAPGTLNHYVIMDDFAPMLTRQVLYMVTELSRQTGIRCEWSLGVGATGIAGLPAYGSAHSPRYDAQEVVYRMTTIASLEEIEQYPGRLTRALVGRLMRALDRESKYESTYFMDPPRSAAGGVA